jgi:transposase InsO family protein
VAACTGSHEDVELDDGIPLVQVTVATVQARDDVLHDIWQDDVCMSMLRDGTVPSDSHELSRVRKRIKWYRWNNQVLYRYVKDKRSNQLALRQVPHPSVREQNILTLHCELGHVGEKRTIDAVSQVYWWHGYTTDVKRVLSGCKLCRRVGVAPPNLVLDMQTESHDDYGMFYRWGLDYLGELAPSALGNRYALIAIDYFSKWIEVFPVIQADSATTARLVLTQLIARYGVPAEIVCDNGTPFKGDFEKFCVEKLINQQFITPGMPRSNGLAENAVKTVKRALQKHAAHSKGASDWDTEGLANILLGYRCTKQAATQLSPAQVLFAQDPAVNADKWIVREGAMAFNDIEGSAKELIRRAELAKALRIQVAENLRLAHARNAARFKALRSGLYQPKIHHFQPGDFVFVTNPGEQTPGGALGIPVRDEILKVIEVRPSGVLLLENQGGRTFTRHVEQCVPCNLSNVEGTVHPDLIKPSWKYPCTICGDHKQGSKMLLCDGCNLGFHTFCLPVPLDEVPDGVWLCNSCTTAGITPAQVRERQARYIPVEQSRPHIELPGDSRRRRARMLADKWHGAPVRHVTKTDVRHGRVTFTSITNPKWFKVYWNNGDTSMHDSRFLSRLEIIKEQDAPNDLLPRPDPVVILVLKEVSDWSVLTPGDVLARLQQSIPGEHGIDEATFIHSSLGHKRRKLMTQQDLPNRLAILNSTVMLEKCQVILDPWAGNRAVRKGLRTGRAKACFNDRLGGKDAHLHLEPLEAEVYRTVIRTLGTIHAIVMAPPLGLATIALANALDFAEDVVCMLVTDIWLLSLPRTINLFLTHLEQAGRLLVIVDVSGGGEYRWVCVFSSPASRARLMRDWHDHGEAAYQFMQTC